MAKLKDIKGYWDATYCYDFNDINMWEGQILLDEDGWFEGIVVDTKSSYTEDRFVFGIYYPDKVIELYKFTPISVSNPFVFCGKKENDRYVGEFEVIRLLGPSPYGVHNIITQDAEQVRGNVDKEIDQLKARINNYKENIMDETGKTFYDNSIAMKNAMCQIVLRNYENRGFTTEEAIKIMEECQPVADRVVDRTMQEVKRLVRTMPDYIIEDDDN